MENEFLKDHYYYVNTDIINCKNEVIYSLNRTSEYDPNEVSENDNYLTFQTRLNTEENYNINNAISQEQSSIDDKYNNKYRDGFSLNKSNASYLDYSNNLNCTNTPLETDYNMLDSNNLYFSNNLEISQFIELNPQIRRTNSDKLKYKYYDVLKTLKNAKSELNIGVKYANTIENKNKNFSNAASSEKSNKINEVQSIFDISTLIKRIENKHEIFSSDCHTNIKENINKQDIGFGKEQKLIKQKQKKSNSIILRDTKYNYLYEGKEQNPSSKPSTRVKLNTIKLTKMNNIKITKEEYIPKSSRTKSKFEVLKNQSSQGNSLNDASSKPSQIKKKKNLAISLIITESEKIKTAKEDKLDLQKKNKKLSNSVVFKNLESENKIITDDSNNNQLPMYRKLAELDKKAKQSQKHPQDHQLLSSNAKGNNNNYKISKINNNFNINDKDAYKYIVKKQPSISKKINKDSNSKNYLTLVNKLKKEFKPISDENKNAITPIKKKNLVHDYYNNNTENSIQDKKLINTSYNTTSNDTQIKKFNTTSKFDKINPNQLNNNSNSTNMNPTTDSHFKPNYLKKDNKKLLKTFTKNNIPSVSDKIKINLLSEQKQRNNYSLKHENVDSYNNKSKNYVNNSSPSKTSISTNKKTLLFTNDKNQDTKLKNAKNKISVDFNQQSQTHNTGFFNSTKNKKLKQDFEEEDSLVDSFNFFTDLKQNFLECEKKFYQENFNILKLDNFHINCQVNRNVYKITNIEDDSENNYEVNPPPIHTKEKLNEFIKIMSKQNEFYKEYFSLISIYYKVLLQRNDKVEKIKSNQLRIIKNNKKAELEKKLEEIKLDYENLKKDYENFNDSKTNMISLSMVLNLNEKNSQKNLYIDNPDNSLLTNNTLNINFSEGVENSSTFFNKEKSRKDSSDAEHEISYSINLKLDKEYFSFNEDVENNNNYLQNMDSAELHKEILELEDMKKNNLQKAKKNFDQIKQNEKKIFELNKFYYDLQEIEIETIFIGNEKDKELPAAIEIKCDKNDYFVAPENINKIIINEHAKNDSKIPILINNKSFNVLPIFKEKNLLKYLELQKDVRFMHHSRSEEKLNKKITNKLVTEFEIFNIEKDHAKRDSRNSLKNKRKNVVFKDIGKEYNRNNHSNYDKSTQVTEAIYILQSKNKTDDQSFNSSFDFHEKKDLILDEDLISNELSRSFSIKYPFSFQQHFYKEEKSKNRYYSIPNKRISDFYYYKNGNQKVFSDVKDNLSFNKVSKKPRDKKNINFIKILSDSNSNDETDMVIINPIEVNVQENYNEEDKNKNFSRKNMNIYSLSSASNKNIIPNNKLVNSLENTDQVVTFYRFLNKNISTGNFDNLIKLNKANALSMNNLIRETNKAALNNKSYNILNDICKNKLKNMHAIDSIKNFLNRNEEQTINDFEVDIFESLKCNDVSGADGLEFDFYSLK